MPNPASAGLPNAASYTDNGDGTVTDKITGLLWERLVSGSTYTQPNAARYCTGKGMAWRLPTRLELVSLVDFTVADPGPTINPMFPDTPATVFWTSSMDVGNSSSAWGVFFDIGYSDRDDISDTGSVRCVSSAGVARMCPPDRFQVTSSEVHDAATGLTWQQDAGTAMFTWTEANAHCAGLGGGWRLPSMTELQTIVDDSRSAVAIDSRAFPNTPAAVFWTSSPVAGQPYAWAVDFSTGSTTNPDLTSPYQVRCVR